MKIGILGVGNIGKTLTLRLSAAGHEVKVANSRGPETLDKALFAHGAKGVTAEDAVKDVDVVITSMPPAGILKTAPLIKALPEHVVVLDTFNYYPKRDERIEELEGENAKVESIWLSEQWGGRPVVKVFNSIYTEPFELWGKPKGSPGRIAIPFAADSDHQIKITTEIIEATGFDAYHAGPLSESWRFQPGTPCYCTCPTLDELPKMLAAADKSRRAKRRDLCFDVVMDQLEDPNIKSDVEWANMVNRVVNSGRLKWD